MSKKSKSQERREESLKNDGEMTPEIPAEPTGKKITLRLLKNCYVHGVYREKGWETTLPKVVADKTMKQTNGLFEVTGEVTK